MLELGRRRLGALAIVAGLMAVASPVSGAVARPSLTTSFFTIRHKDVAVAGNTTKGTTATCPSGDRVVNGGAHWITGGPSNTSGGLWLGSSFPAANLKGWTASGARTGPAAGTLRVYATCAPSSLLPAYKVVAGRVNLPHRNDENQVVVLCPTGYSIITGGTMFQSLDSNTPKPSLPGITTGSTPLSGAGGWAGLGRNVGGLVGVQKPMRLRVVAVCAKTSKVGTYDVEGDSFPPDTVTSGNASCSAGQAAVAAGAYWHASADGNIDPTLPGTIIDSYPKPHGTGWIARGGDSEGTDTGLSVLAYCRPD